MQSVITLFSSLPTAFSQQIVFAAEFIERRFRICLKPGRKDNSNTCQDLDRLIWTVRTLIYIVLPIW